VGVGCIHMDCGRFRDALCRTRYCSAVLHVFGSRLMTVVLERSLGENCVIRSFMNALLT
jgi:hypothetical protein